MAMLQESCRCGSTFSASVGEPYFYKAERALENWRQRHLCTEVRTTSAVVLPDQIEQWRIDRVGDDCAVCIKPCDDASKLTSFSSMTVHIDCKLCTVCRKGKRTNLVWACRPGDTRQTIMHPLCLRKLEDVAHG